MSSYGLAIHTSTSELGLAIGSPTAELKTQVWDLGRSLSTHLHAHLAQFVAPLSWGQLAWLAVAVGPGGFTGIRLGIVTARTLAQQLNIPLFSISSLAAFAQYHYLLSSETKTYAAAIQMQAQREEVFGGIYSLQDDRLGVRLPDQVYRLKTWQDILATWPDPIEICTAEGGLGSSVVGVWHLAQQQWQGGARPNWADSVPFYGQHPVAIVCS